MILSLVNTYRPHRLATALVAFILAAFASGCGSSTPTASPVLDNGKKLEDVVPPEKLYKIEGKTKVELSRKERRQLYNEAVKKAQ